MLIKVIVKNYILIDDLEIDFDSGLNVLTGETGAGKSIILGAIRLALGGRGSTNVVRQGSDKAVVQAVFVVDQAIAAQLAELIDTSENMVIFRRELHHNGKSIMKLNDVVVTLNQAKKIADLLLSIHGQNDYQALLDGDGQLQLIDSFLAPTGLINRQKVAELYAELAKINQRIADLTIEPQQIEREIDLINFQIEDIDRAALTADDEMVELRFKRMAKAARLATDFVAVDQLIDGEQGGLNISRAVNQLIAHCAALAEAFPAYQSAIEQLNDFSYALAELANQAQRDSAELADQLADQAALTARLDVVNALKKKYGKTVEAIADYRSGLDARLAELNQLAELKDELQLKYQQLRESYLMQCQALTNERKRAADTFLAQLTAELRALQFGDVSLTIDYAERKNFSIYGRDVVDIKISLNRGMAVDSLKKIASGGEISRLMLAIKKIVAHRAGVPVLIFDEIDSGVSGVTGSVVADKLYDVARHRQVICISHLAQVALMADRHFLIVKDTVADLAISKVYPLTTAQRVDEIARLISGKLSDESQRAQAQKLIDSAARNKQFISEQSGV